MSQCYADTAFVMERRCLRLSMCDSGHGHMGSSLADVRPYSGSVLDLEHGCSGATGEFAFAPDLVECI